MWREPYLFAVINTTDDPTGRLIYEQMLEAPAGLYGSGLGSNYQAQGLKLSKHFRAG